MEIEDRLGCHQCERILSRRDCDGDFRMSFFRKAPVTQVLQAFHADTLDVAQMDRAGRY